MLKQKIKLLEARLALIEKEQAAYVQAKYFLYEQMIKEKDEEIKFLKSCSRIPEKDVLKCLQEGPPDKSDSDSSSSTSSVEETLAEFKNRVIHDINAKFDQAWHAFKAMVEAKLPPSLNSPLLPKQ